MHKKAEELMFADLLRFSEEGKIELFNNTAFLFPSEYVLKLEEHLSAEEIYVLAKKIPQPIVDILIQRGMKDLERLDFLLELAEVLGMGSVQIPNFDRENVKHEVIVKNSTPNKISCHHTRGYLSTAFSTSLKRKFECQETKCVSKGADACLFVLTNE